MSKTIPAVFGPKDVVLVPEHILLDNGVRVLDGVHYGEGKPQVHPVGARRQTSNTEGESLTKQAFGDETDISSIVKKALRGQPVSVVNDVPQFLDLTDVPDYQTALNQVLLVNGIFGNLDAHKRARFANDPAQMVAFLSDPANHKEAVELGLIDAPRYIPTAESEAPEGGVAAPTGAEGSGA